MLRNKSSVEAVTPALAFNGLRLYQAASNEAALSIVRTENKSASRNMAENEAAIAPTSTIFGKSAHLIRTRPKAIECQIDYPAWCILRSL
jgi:hypothetical protein